VVIIFSNWFSRVGKIKSQQPHWITPVATTTPRLEEEARGDQEWLQGVAEEDGGKESICS
jgi:hypothetical protein